MKKKWAFVLDGKVTEYRDYDVKDIPEHKRYLWTEVVEDHPKFNPAYQELKGPEVVVRDDKVVFQYHMIDLPDKRLIAKIEEEGNRRVDELFPPTIKPLYGAMLVRTKKGETLTKKEQSEFDEIERAFPDMEDIRECQKKLQSMDPIPKDYTKDKYWK